MCCTDAITGETLFSYSAPTFSRKVILEYFFNHKCFRIPMRQQASEWIARVALSPGWIFYRFEVDGKVRRDREGNKLKALDGRPCSLAVIQPAAGSRRKIA